MKRFKIFILEKNEWEKGKWKIEMEEIVIERVFEGAVGVNLINNILIRY